MDKIFKLKEHHADVKNEILAGLTTFMTMAYVLAVQPGAIVGAEATITDCNGDVISKSAILVMCALVSGLITILMAFYANMPFALSTGMGTNFLLGAMIQGGTMSFGSAMVITLISGVIFVALTVLGLAIIGVLTAYNVKGAILIGIAVITVLGIPFGITVLPAHPFAIPDFSDLSTVCFNFDFSGLYILCIPMVLYFIYN